MSSPIVATAPTLALSGLAFNTREASGVEWMAERLDGFGSPRGTLQVVQRPRQHGGWSGDSFLVARTQVIAGWCSAPDIVSLLDARDRLTAACTLAATTLDIETPGAGTRTLTVRRDGDVIWQPQGPRHASWSVQLVADDPRMVGAALQSSTGLPSSTGGLEYPITYPITYTGVTTSGVISINNPGNVAAPVRLRIDGSVVGPIVTHTGSSGYQVFSFVNDFEVALGDWLDIDMELRRVLANGQSSRNGYISSRGWFALDPGANDITFQAASYSASAQLTVYTNDGAWE
jgi:hypothetical protein